MGEVMKVKNISIIVRSTLLFKSLGFLMFFYVFKDLNVIFYDFF